MRLTLAARAASIVALLIGCGFSTALAQVIQPPSRSRPNPATANRVSEQLTLAVDALGGYDDNLALPDTSGSQVFADNPSGYTGFASALLHYRRGTSNDWVDTSGSVFMNSYRNAGRVPGYGGEERFAAHSTIGRRTQISASQRLRNAPYYGLGNFSSLPPEAGQPPVDGSSSSALARQRAWNVDASAGVLQQWTRKTSTNLSYDFNNQSYANNASVDTRTHSALLSYDHGLTRRFALQSSYKFSTTKTLQPTIGLQLLDGQNLDAGLRYIRNLSATRRLSLSGGGGALQVETTGGIRQTPQKQLSPSGYGNVGVDLARTWRINGEYRRSVSVLQGERLQAFVTDATSISVGGRVHSRLETTFSGAYAAGQPQQFPGIPTGTLDSYLATGQLRVLVTGRSSLVLNYTRYQYTLDRVSSVLLGISPYVLRNTVQIGYSMSLPLVNSPKMPRQGGPGRRTG